MAVSQNIQATFATLPREIRDMVYTQMLTNTETIDTINHTDGLGKCQQEDWKTLRGTLHACRDMPQYAEEAIEVFFGMHTIKIEAEHDYGFLNRTAYYVKARGFIPIMTLVKSVETRLTISTFAEKAFRDPLRLRKCFRDLLACPALRHVTVNVSIPRDWDAEPNDIPTAAVIKEDDLADLDIILNAATGSWQGLKQRLGPGLKISSRHQRFRENIQAWEERVGKAAVEETQAGELETEGSLEDANFRKGSSYLFPCITSGRVTY